MKSLNKILSDIFNNQKYDYLSDEEIKEVEDFIHRIDCELKILDLLILE
jgi:hypothetical protein